MLSEDEQDALMASLEDNAEVIDGFEDAMGDKVRVGWLPGAGRGPVPHSCEVTALLGGTTYRCWSHEDGRHHFAARWPACATPWCRADPGHRALHDIPPGRPVFRDGQGNALKKREEADGG